MKRRIWSHAEGPYGFRVRLLLEPDFSPNIYVQIRDARRPGGERRVRTLSLRHHDRERAIKYAQRMVQFWMRHGRPPRIVWRKQRHGGPKPKGVLVPAA